MEETTSITYTVAIPEDLIPEIEAYVKSHQDQGSLNYEKKTPATRKPGDALPFEPFTIGFGFVVLKFVGAKALDLGLGVLGAVIIEKLKARWKKDEPKEVELYLSTGEKVSLKLHEEPDQKALAEKLKEST
jgi:hypothetical protein